MRPLEEEGRGPDSLIGTIPNLYYYAANNPSGRRGDPLRNRPRLGIRLERGGGWSGSYMRPCPGPEATIAKRRSYAATVSYLTPPAENAGRATATDKRMSAGARQRPVQGARGAAGADRVIPDPEGHRPRAEHCGRDRRQGAPPPSTST